MPQRVSSNRAAELCYCAPVQQLHCRHLPSVHSVVSLSTAVVPWQAIDATLLLPLHHARGAPSPQHARAHIPPPQWPLLHTDHIQHGHKSVRMHRRHCEQKGEQRALWPECRQSRAAAQCTPQCSVSVNRAALLQQCSPTVRMRTRRTALPRTADSVKIQSHCALPTRNAVV